MIISELKERIKRVKTSMKEEGLENLLLYNQKNVTYLTGRGTGAALIRKNSTHIWVKELYRDLFSDLYEKGNYPLNVHILEKDAIKKYFKKNKISALGVENLRQESLLNLKKELRVRTKTTNLVMGVRVIKSDYEIKKIKKAALVAKLGMKKAYEIIKPGVFECDALAEIERTIRKAGSEEPPFGCGALLSSGADSANIHAFAKKKKIKKGSFVVVDLGAKMGDYYSDMTRTIPVGGKKIIKEKDRKLLLFVENLELSLIDRIKDEILASELHNIAKKEIEKAGYKFYHPLGHGVGLDVHERPNLSFGSKDTLDKGMVFTIEPGIYIPGKYGIRFEDMVLIDKRGRTRILTR